MATNDRADAWARLPDGGTELQRLQDALVVAEANNRLHAAALSRLQGEFMASRLEVEGARGETVNYRGYLMQSQEAIKALSAQLEALQAEVAVSRAELTACRSELATSREEAATLRRRLVLLYGSLSWRVTKPLRVAGRAARRLRRAP